MTPMILWISGGGSDGKTTLRRELLGQGSVPLFKVDPFCVRINEWFPETEVLQKCLDQATKKSRNVLDYIYKAGYGELCARMFLEHPIGFHPKGNLNVLDGYMHKGIQDMISKTLENRGFYVWYAMRRHRLKNIRNDNNWQ